MTVSTRVRNSDSSVLCFASGSVSLASSSAMRSAAAIFVRGTCCVAAFLDVAVGVFISPRELLLLFDNNAVEEEPLRALLSTVYEFLLLLLEDEKAPPATAVVVFGLLAVPYAPAPDISLDLTVGERMEGLDAGERPKF